MIGYTDVYIYNSKVVFKKTIVLNIMHEKFC